jgi:uncharacterized protein (DUF983 family)
MIQHADEFASTRPRLGATVRRGLRGRCPRCGEGALFQRWIKTHERCSACQLQYQKNYGDIWIFIILMDRIPVVFALAALYFGFRVSGPAEAIAFFLALAIPLIATMRQRQGVALALDYLTRVYLPD